MTSIQMAVKLIDSTRGEQQQWNLNEALKFWTFDELSKAMKEYRATKAN